MQRSVEDPNVLMATYEGEHNHGVGSSRSSEGVGETVEVVGSAMVDNLQKSTVQQFLVQQMATSLTRDPRFTAALATAISGRMLDHPSN